MSVMATNWLLLGAISISAAGALLCAVFGRRAFLSSEAHAKVLANDEAASHF